MSSTSTTAIGLVKAIDPDSDRFGSVSYRLSSSSVGTTGDYFRVDSVTGEIFLLRSLRSFSTTMTTMTTFREFVFNVSASDGMGLKSAKEARVTVCLTDETVARFDRSKYAFNVPEDAATNYPVGSISIYLFFNKLQNIFDQITVKPS